MTRLTITVDIDADPGPTARALGLPHAWAIADHIAQTTRNALRDAGAMRVTVEAHKTDVRNRAHYDYTETAVTADV